MPLASASSTARLEGALTAASTGMPARAAFWTSSKEARPETWRTVPAQRQQPFAQGPAHHLVHGVVPAHVLAQAQQLSAAVVVNPEEPGSVHTAGVVEDRLCLAEPVRQRGQRLRPGPSRGSAAGL